MGIDYEVKLANGASLPHQTRAAVTQLVYAAGGVRNAQQDREGYTIPLIDSGGWDVAVTIQSHRIAVGLSDFLDARQPHVHAFLSGLERLNLLLFEDGEVAPLDWRSLLDS